MKALAVTKKMTGKMENMISINTSSLNNPFCIAMSKKDNAICKDCYSNSLLKMYKTADARFQLNGEYLASRLHDVKELPRINAAAVRFNAYGELINYEHCVNLFTICKANKNTTFTLWTKKTGLVHKAIRDWGKPKNLILIYSSPEVNIRGEKPKHFDKVFTVYDNTKQVKINCAETKCFDCMKCYTLGDRTIYINELIKSKQKRR